MFEQFKSKAEAASAEVFRFRTTAEAVDHLVSLLKQNGLADAPQATALCADGPWLTPENRSRLAAIPGVYFEVTRNSAAAAQFGISLMEWALADTGSLAQNATAVEQRLVSSLVSVHIAIVPTAGLLPDLPALLTRIDPKKLSYLALITGPSRTADIERVLTIGVHGPKRLIILFVDDLPSAH
jgi:L-lactate dehydrogenase complex protein LldG